MAGISKRCEFCGRRKRLARLVDGVCRDEKSCLMSREKIK